MERTKCYKCPLWDSFCHKCRGDQYDREECRWDTSNRNDNGND